MSNGGADFGGGLATGLVLSACIAGFGIADSIDSKEWQQGQLICSRYGEELKHIGGTFGMHSGYEYHIQCGVKQLDLPEEQFWIKQQGEETLNEGL